MGPDADVPQRLRRALLRVGRYVSLGNTSVNDNAFDFHMDQKNKSRMLLGCISDLEADPVAKEKFDIAIKDLVTSTILFKMIRR